MSSSPSISLQPSANINPRPLGFALLFIVIGALYLAEVISARQSALYIVGALLGVALYHAAFGFTSAWRVFIADGRGEGLRAQMLMLAVGVALFFPALAAGSLFGTPVSGLVQSAGTSVIVGAFIFGIGMQLGGGCASGTLYTVGGGSTRMIVTLIAFVVGSVIGTAYMPFWTSLPQLQPISLVKTLGLAPALALNWLVFALIAAITVVVEKRRHGKLVRAHTQPAHTSPWLHGPWPLVAGAIALVVLNFATMALSGRPWGVTSAFALWGAKGASLIGTRYRQLGLLVDQGECRGTGRADHARCDVRDGYWHRARRDGGGGAGRPLCAGLAPAAALVCGGSGGWFAAGFWCTPRVWLQYRRLLQRHRVGQPARLAVAGCRVHWQCVRHAFASAVWAGGRTRAANRVLNNQHPYLHWARPAGLIQQYRDVPAPEKKRRSSDGFHDP